MTLCFDKLHRENGKDRGRKETPLPLSWLLSFLLSFLSPSPSSALPTCICCHSYRGAVHFFCSDLVRCSTCHSTPSFALRLGRPSPGAEQSLKSPLLSWVEPLVPLPVSVVCVSGAWWQYLWCLTWSGRGVSTWSNLPKHTRSPPGLNLLPVIWIGKIKKVCEGCFSFSLCCRLVHVETTRPNQVRLFSWAWRLWYNWSGSYDDKRYRTWCNWRD